MLPVLFNFALFTFYAYPVFMGLAWGVGYYLTQLLFAKYRENSSNLFKLYFGVFFSSWIGSKFFFLLFSTQHKIYQYLYAGYFWLGGGFVFYGGLLFGLVFFSIYSLWFKKFNFQKTYLLVPGLIFGHAIGRVGCFLAGCCYGAPSLLPWSVFIDGKFRHPVQLYESLALCCLGFLTLKWIKVKKTNLFIVSNYLISYSVLRFVMEFFRGDEVRGIFWSLLSTSQIISLGLFVVSLIIQYFFNFKRIKHVC